MYRAHVRREGCDRLATHYIASENRFFPRFFPSLQRRRVARVYVMVTKCPQLVVITCRLYTAPARLYTLFLFGSIYAFQGTLSPVSCCSIVETCILPILLYGVENWVLSPESIGMLKSFQGEIAKRILQLPKWYSNTAATVALGQNSLHSVCTIRKLRCLNRVITNEKSICHRAFSAMVDDVESLSIVRECRELEERYKTNLTTECNRSRWTGHNQNCSKRASTT